MRHGMAWCATVALATSVLLNACGDVTKCDEALEKLVDECEVSGASLDNSLKECKDMTKCFAKCVNEADCDDITNGKYDNYDECIADCYTRDYD